MAGIPLFNVINKGFDAIFNEDIDLIPGLGANEDKRAYRANIRESTPVSPQIDAGLSAALNKSTPGAGEVAGGGIVDPAAIEASRKASRVNNLRGDIRGRQGEVMSVYDQLFADLGNLVNSRRADIDKSAGESVKKLTDTYVGSIPKIESSYAALGAGDSTDNTYAKVDAKTGFEGSVDEVGKQKDKDLTTLGQYDQETRAGWDADRDALSRIFSRLDETDNEEDLANARGEVENKLGTARANRATLMTDEGLKGAVNKATDSSSRLQSIQGSLDSILQSSLSGAVKDAAIAAVGQSAGLSDEEKNQIKANSAYQA